MITDESSPYASTAAKDAQPLSPALTSSLPQQANPKRHKRAILLIAGVILMIVLGVGITLYALPRERCLSVSDFSQLTGDEYTGDFDSTQSFYEYMFDFSPNEPNYDATSADDYSYTVRDMAIFYSAHKDKHVVFTIKVYELSSETTALSKLRQEKIRNDLTAAGIPSDVIHTSSLEATKNLAEDERSDESADSLGVSITSDATCNQ